MSHVLDSPHENLLHAKKQQLRSKNENIVMQNTWPSFSGSFQSLLRRIYRAEWNPYWCRHEKSLSTEESLSPVLQSLTKRKECELDLWHGWVPHQWPLLPASEILLFWLVKYLVVAWLGSWPIFFLFSKRTFRSSIRLSFVVWNWLLRINILQSVCILIPILVAKFFGSRFCINNNDNH